MTEDLERVRSQAQETIHLLEGVKGQMIEMGVLLETHIDEETRKKRAKRPDVVQLWCEIGLLEAQADMIRDSIDRMNRLRKYIGVLQRDEEKGHE